LIVLNFELRALLDRHSTTWATPPTLSVFIMFEIGFHFMPGLMWTWLWSSYLCFCSCVVRMTGACYHTQPLFWVPELFFWVGLKPKSSPSSPLE
jgi:hypothetical protein